MKDSIRLNCRISKNKQLKILEEHYDGTLDSILFPTLSGEITGFSIFMVVNFAYYKDIIELILQVKERYEYIFDKQMHYFSRKQKDYINKVYGNKANWPIINKQIKKYRIRSSYNSIKRKWINSKW